MKIRCPACDGVKMLIDRFNHMRFRDCYVCKGKGTITPTDMEAPDLCSYQLDIRRAEKAGGIIRFCFNGCDAWISDALAVEMAYRLIDCVSQPPPREDDHPVRRRRHELDMTQEELASLAGLSRTYLSEVERGEAKNLSLKAARRLATALDCTLDDLF